MPHRLYRFEIATDDDSAWVANSCEAWDSGFDRKVVLRRYPLPAISPEKLEEGIRSANNIESDAEAFTHDAYLYVATPDGLLSDRLKDFLQEQRLVAPAAFAHMLARVAAPPIATSEPVRQTAPFIPEPLPAPPAVASPPQRSSRGKTLLWLTIILAVALAGILIWRGGNTGLSSSDQNGGRAHILYFRASPSLTSSEEAMLTWEVEYASSVAVNLATPNLAPPEGDRWRNPGLPAPAGHVYRLTAKGKGGTCLVSSLDLRHWEGRALSADPPENCSSK